MSPRLPFCFFVLLALAALAGPARAQAQPAAPGSASAPAGAPATVTLSGRTEDAAGPLGGAVVRLVRSKQMCVTNSEGLFFFTVPADAGPLDAVATYTNTADVPFTIEPAGPPAVVKLETPKLGKKDQKQLKSSIKRGNRETKRSLKKLK